MAGVTDGLVTADVGAAATAAAVRVLRETGWSSVGPFFIIVPRTLRPPFIRPTSRAASTRSPMGILETGHLGHAIYLRPGVPHFAAAFTAQAVLSSKRSRRGRLQQLPVPQRASNRRYCFRIRFRGLLRRHDVRVARGQESAAWSLRSPSSELMLSSPFYSGR